MKIVAESSAVTWVLGLLLGGMAASSCSVAAGTTAVAEPAAPSALQAQLARGEKVYRANCAECHGPDLGGGMGSILRGDAFLDFWNGKPLGDLAQRILYTMPATAPGSLSDGEAADVTLYVLDRNGVALPAGASADALAKHLIARPAK